MSTQDDLTSELELTKKAEAEASQRVRNFDACNLRLQRDFGMPKDNICAQVADNYRNIERNLHTLRTEMERRTKRA